MIRNNIKALCIHAVVCFLSFLIYITFFSAIPKWVSEEAANQYYFKMRLISLIVIIGAIFIYYLSGKKFLKDEGSILKNLTSVSIVAIIGVWLWIATLVLLLLEGDVSKSQSVSYYYIYNAYLIPLIFNLNINSTLYFFSLIFSFVPSIAMTIGIYSQKKSLNIRKIQ